MNITIREPSLGECNIKTVEDIPKDAQYLIKALCALQILCMNAATDKSRYKEFCDIIREAANKANVLYNPPPKEDINAAEYFD